MDSNILDYLEAILQAVYGRDVRQAIHDSIEACYNDGRAGSIDITARRQIANIVAHNNDTENDPELIDARTGYNGTIFDSTGDAIRGQVDELKALIDNVIREIEDSRLGADEYTYDSLGEAVRTQIAELLVKVEELSSDEKKDFATIEFNNSDRLLHFYDEFGNDVYDPVFIESGVGSSSNSGVIVRLTNQNGVSSLAGSYGKAVNLMFTFTSTEDDLPTGNATCVITVNGATKVRMNIPQGLTAIDVSPHLNVGTNTVVVTCTDAYGNSRRLSYTVTLVKLSIETTFDATIAYTDDILFKYTPYGAVEKTIHFVVDGTEIGTVVTSLSGKQMTRTIPMMSHGAHKLEVYSTAKLEDSDLESDKLVYDIICLETGNTTPLIASAFGVETLSQGEQVSIPYIVYDPTKLACDIKLEIYTLDSGTEVVHFSQEITVDRNQWVWNTRRYPVGTVYFRIGYPDGNISKTHYINVTPSKIQVEAETNDLELYLTSEGRSNNEVNPNNWAYGDYFTTFTGVNWSSVGWVDDTNGDACLRLNGDARAVVGFKPFSEDIRVYGKTIELDFAIRDVNNKDATVITCMSGGIGVEVKADTAYLVSEQSRVFCNYKPEERVKVTFTVESRSEYRLLSIYLNGVLSDAIQYPTTDNFQQTSPVDISIGSSDCGIDLYNIRSYSTALPDSVVANNYIADLTDITKKTETFEDNDIYDEYGNISFHKAKAKNSTMVIVGTLPKSKGDKKPCIVHYYDVENSNLDYTDDGVTIDVQGTSSQWYVRKNWKLKCSEPHYIDADQLPTDVICIKVDYAEATGTHNTQNANFVHRLYSEPIPAQATEPKARTTIYGKPILLFHQKDANSEPEFYGKANFNYDKGSESVFGFTPAYDVESWEFCNNTSDACNFLGPIPTDWSEDFEARYPDKYKNISRFRQMHNWVVSTKGNVTKFKEEFEDWFDLHYSLIYYVYTFFALMVDQRAKNMFLTYWGETGKWYPYFYDNDTCFGINNEGQLVFDYYHEDTDQLAGANVYNGQNSTLWCNFREAFADEIQAMYQDLRSNGVLNYAELVEQFITNGSDKWSESIYNEDGDFKYISMLRSEGDASNLPQVRGTGEEHFKYFIENRINYCDSKWYASDYADDYISLRIYTPETWAGVAPNADITVTPYSHMYAGVRYKANGNLYQERVDAGEDITFEAPNETFNDTETAIYNASRISSLGDLSPLYCGSINVAKATKLTELIIGSTAAGYSNGNLTELSVGTNKLLRKIDVRNCPNFASSLGLAGCPNIEEVYATGTSITGIELADSGCLRIAKLPATVTNITLKGQHYIEDFTLASYSSLKTLWIEDCIGVDSLAILQNGTNIDRARLTGVNWSYADASAVLALIDRNIAGIDETGTNTNSMWVDGTCHITTLTGAEMKRINEAFPYLKITYTNLTSTLTFMTWDGQAVIATQTITNGGDGVIPSLSDSQLTRAETDQYSFTYNGWSTMIDADGGDPNALKNVEADRTLYMAFAKTLKYYDVKFYNGTTLLETQSIGYGHTAYYSGEDPERTGVSNPDDWEFAGWSPAPTNITGATSCYAQYEFVGLWSRAFIKRIISDEYVNDRVTNVGGYAFYGMTKLTSLSLPEVVTLEDNGLNNASGLTTLNLPAVVTLGQNALQNLSKISSLSLPSATTISMKTFMGMTQLRTLHLPSVIEVASYSIYDCTDLRKVDFGSASIIKANAFANCKAVDTLILRYDGLCTLENVNALTATGIGSGNGYIYVPKAHINLYISGSNWSNFFEQFRAIEDYPDICGGEV